MLPVLARAISIVGHPLAVLMAAFLLESWSRGASPGDLRSILVGTAVAGGAVIAYSWYRVRRGDGAHVDASNVGERRSFNRVLLGALGLSAAVAGQRDPLVGRQLALAAAIVGTGMLTAGLCKLSIHVGFAVFAALIALRVSVAAGVAFLLLAMAVTWSRLYLGRHVVRDVVAGAAAGLVAGAIAIL